MSDFQDNESAPQENRPFIRETVVNETSGPPLWKKILTTALLAVLFGVIAGAVFRFTQTRIFPPETTTAEPVSFPQETTAPPDETSVPTESDPSAPLSPEDAEWQIIVQGMIDSHDLQIKDYQRMAIVLNGVRSDAQWSLVTVTATNQDQSLFKGGHQYETQSFGVIIAITEQEVLVLTPYSATTQLSDSSTLQIGFANLEVTDAYIKARDGVADLMIMAVSRSKITEQTLERIKAIRLGNSYVCYAGQPVIAMGAPIGGIIKSCNSGILTYIESAYPATDASLSLLHTNMVGDENAGGFLINLDGSLIGWIEPEYTSGGTLTAVGISDLRAYIETISNGSQGCYLGIEGITLSNELKEALKTEADGIYISRCTAGSPAQRAGLQAGDILIQVAGDPVRNLDELRTILLSFTAEQTISVKVLRKGRASYQELTYDVNIERR
nr:PDZ domain-containing protein [Lachnospiraceae bacterium]